MALNSPNPAAVVIKGIGEAPVDGQQYARQDADWVAAGGGMQSIQYIEDSGTWTRPAGITKVRVYVTGGGGSGSTQGGSNHNTGGQGGSTAIKFFDVSSVPSATVIIGSGAPANTSTATTGQNGGDSIWDDGTNYLFGGGGSGHGQTWKGINASGGDMNIPGMNGTGYIGGASFWASQSHGNHNQSSANYLYMPSIKDPSVAGFGQGGIAYYGSGVTGYAGGLGIIVVEEYA